MTRDNTQSDVVEAWDRLTGCANACGFPSIEAAIEHLADIHLASLSTKDGKSPRERLAAKVGVAIANRANLGHEPPVSTKDSDGLAGCRTCGNANRSHFDHVAPFGEGYHTSSDAVLKERERCARIAEEWMQKSMLSGDCDTEVAQRTGKAIAAAIRKGDNA